MKGQMLYECANFMCGCYVHKARSNQSALPIQSHLDVVRYGEHNTGKSLYSASNYRLFEYELYFIPATQAWHISHVRTTT